MTPSTRYSAEICNRQLWAPHSHGVGVTKQIVGADFRHTYSYIVDVRKKLLIDTGNTYT